ncbi:PTS mannitol transporter subunit IICBA [Brochothrix thermosphacta]|uniref:PTS mannitol transporter subunit IICBA n=1 Tax=Brochothrix thermosphacta TaxID=2756 RepID=UPI000A1AA475|nr:PTS system, mannitol-specific IIB component / PTS system, mannitol-specific IIC component [Brachybacterium faecium]
MAKEKASGRQGIQKFGNFLSSMVLPNIGAFIAWGLITALFIPDGWWPNKAIAELVGPMVNYLLPLLIGFSGGKIVHGHRGGVVGAIATMGVIVGSDVPMFLGAMIMGPLAGYLMKKFDALIEGKIKSGLEMLVNNFSAGILGGILAVIGLKGVGPVMAALNNTLASAVDWIVNANLLPLASIFIEPGKVLFLNNAINQGILTPLGVQQAAESGKSVLFLLEANPGPGFGILLALSLFGTGAAKRTAPGAAIIQFVGGIHEIYFPYILMKPALLIAAIAGGMSGVFTLTLFNGGLIGPASPGSILAVLAATPKGFANYGANLAGVIVATVVSFAVAALILRFSKKSDESIEDATAKMNAMKGKESSVAGHFTDTSSTTDLKAVNKIVFACDAGMGSSAMGASLLRKKVKQAKLDITVTNTAISQLPSDAQIIITQRELTPRAKDKRANALHISVDNFLDSPEYDNLIERLTATHTESEAVEEATPVNSSAANLAILNTENVYLNKAFVNKDEAIRFAGEKLVEKGYVATDYVEAMITRDNDLSTYMGNEVAIPHGTEAAKQAVKKSGVIIVQVPEGVDFNGNQVKLIFAIAGANNDHLEILSMIAETCADMSEVDAMVIATDKETLVDHLTKAK